MSKRNRILVVDDDDRVRRILSRYLSREGYVVDEAASGTQMRACLAAQSVDLVILDLMLPDTDGLSLARELRRSSEVAIIMLTGKVDPVDRVVGLELGADDYVTKPFDQRELLARVRTVLRRAAGRETSGEHGWSSARFAGWTLDLIGQVLTSPKGQTLDLTSAQFQLIATLVLHADRALSRNEIMQSVSGRSWNPTERGVDVMIAKLRKKLEKDPKAPSLIKTVRGLGYTLAARVELS